MFLILIIIILIILTLTYNSQKQIENYYNIVPYLYHNNIYKCLDRKCTIDNSYKCYKYCSNIKDDASSPQSYTNIAEGQPFVYKPSSTLSSGKDGARKQCELECFNVGDETFDSIKYQNYNWANELPYAYNFRLFNEDDYVLTNMV